MAHYINTYYVYICRFMFIVNHPKGNNSFIQKVEVGECVNAKKECGDGEVFDARTECHQAPKDQRGVSFPQKKDIIFLNITNPCNISLRLKFVRMMNISTK